MHTGYGPGGMLGPVGAYAVMHGVPSAAGTLVTADGGGARWYAFVKLTGAAHGMLLQVRAASPCVEYIESGWISQCEVIRWAPCKRRC